MIKECQVTKQNEHVSVVKYDDNYIQFPSVNTKEKSVYVLFDGKKYQIIDTDRALQMIQSESKRKTKKTTSESVQKEPTFETTET